MVDLVHLPNVSNTGYHLDDVQQSYYNQVPQIIVCKAYGNCNGLGKIVHQKQIHSPIYIVKPEALDRNRTNLPMC